METFLVTGAMGFVGSHWSEYLLKKGKKVYGIDLGLRAEHLLDYEKFIFVHDTIKNYDILRTLVEQVDCVCHFAGIASPEQYIKYPRKVIDITAVAGVQLIEMCRMREKLFFFTSTSEVYGKNNDVPFKEEDDRVLGATTTPRWCYASAKALLEHYLDACALARELDYLIVRLFNVYGPRLNGRVVSDFVDRAMRGEPLVVHGDGRQTRSFTYIDDVIEAFYQLVSDPACHRNVFNIGNPTESTIVELAETVRRIIAPSIDIEFVPYVDYYGDGYEDIYRRVPDVSKLERHIGWAPATTLEAGIGKMHAGLVGTGGQRVGHARSGQGYQ